MNLCQNCGKLNTPETNFCRFCGTKFNFVKPVMTDNPYDYSAPRPYAWKTDEFQTKDEVRPTVPIGTVQPPINQFNGPNQNYRPAPLMYQQQQQQQMMISHFRCPHCMSQYTPRIERRISTAGWITFALLLVFFFPLFWIGLLIKEDVRICQSCNLRQG
ncbi:MAG: LITAF-like zinc ribbon domain-containing protein [Pyrinomonadaceae bacterium]